MHVMIVTAMRLRTQFLCLLCLFLKFSQFLSFEIQRQFKTQKILSSSLHINLQLKLKLSQQESNEIKIPKSDPKLKFDFGRFCFSLIPLTPETTGRRKSILTEIVPNEIWTIDQLQGIINVNVPVRCTIIKLHKDGGSLFINNPVAPTEECIEMVRKIEADTKAKVKHIVLSSLALEHKGTTGLFSSYFPESTVYIQPGQYAFPLDLPTVLFYPLGKPIKPIPTCSDDAPWGDEIAHEILGPLKPRKGPGGFAETSFFHRATRTLCITDAIVRVDAEPPAIVQEDPRALLYHARDDMLSTVCDSPESRRKGWRRMVLFGLVFQPSGITVTDTLQAIRMLDKVSPEMKKLGAGAIPYDGGLYPWRWTGDDRPGFRALQGADPGPGDIALGQLLVPPILQTLILNREPGTQEVLRWVDAVCTRFDFVRIIPCHFANDLAARPADLRKAFEFLLEDDHHHHHNNRNEEKNNMLGFFSGFFKGLLPGTGPGKGAGPGAGALPGDLAFLEGVSRALTEQGVLFPEAAKIKR